MRVALINDTSNVAHPGSALVSRNIFRFLRESGHELIFSSDYSLYFSDRMLHQLEKSKPDLVLIHGEGGLHSSASRPWVSRLLQVIPDYSDKHCIPCIVFNAIIDNLGEKELRNLKRFSSIFVRDKVSQRYLAVNDIDSEFMPDFSVAYAAELPASTIPFKSRTQVVTDSVVSDYTKILKAYSNNQKSKFIYFSPINHRLHLAKLDRFKTVRIITSKFVDPDNTLRIMQNSEGCITGRFHGLMFCLLLKVPFVCIGSNTRKVESALSESVGDLSRLISVEEIFDGHPVTVPSLTEREYANIQAYLTFAQSSLGRLRTAFSG